MTSEQTVRSSDPTSGQRPVGGRHRVATSRNIPVDTLRGLACILLVTFHVIGDKATAGIHVSDDSVFRYYCDSVQYLRMPLFTFLSGLVYAWRPLSDVTGYPSFMRKKARRLLIPYLIFVPILGITQLVAPDVNGSVSFDPLMWWINSLSPYWFLLSTFWLFALVAFLDSYGLLRSPWIFGGLFATVTAVCLFTRPEEIETLQVGTALTFLPFFLAGVESTEVLRSRGLWRCRAHQVGTLCRPANVLSLHNSGRSSRRRRRPLCQLFRHTFSEHRPVRVCIRNHPSRVLKQNRLQK